MGKEESLRLAGYSIRIRDKFGEAVMESINLVFLERITSRSI